MIEKKAIAVFDPSDPWERSIQDAYHEQTGEWLTSYRCRLIASAVGQLKMFDDRWLSNTRLMRQRANYLFSETMSQHKERMVFVTQPLFVRDIMENREIDGYLHSPIVFMTTSLAHYLFPEFSVHIHFNMDMLKGDNTDVSFIDEGGLIIVDKENVFVDPECIIDIVKREQMKKVAVSEVARGVFKIDHDERDLAADITVVRKQDKMTGTVSYVAPGESGTISIRLTDGTEDSFSKEEFDKHFVVV